MSAEKPKPNNRRTILIIAALGLIFACAACGIISTLLPDSSPTTEVAEQPTQTDDLADESADGLTEPPAPTEVAEAEQPEPTIEPSPPPTQTIVPTEPLLPTPTSEPTIAPQATATQLSIPNIGELRELTAAELTLRAAIDEALGESNRGLGRKLNLFSPGLPGLVENSIIVGWAADSAASNALIREGMQRDTLTVLRAVVESGIEYEAVLPPTPPSKGRCPRHLFVPTC